MQRHTKSLQGEVLSFKTLALIYTHVALNSFVCDNCETVNSEWTEEQNK